MITLIILIILISNHRCVDTIKLSTHSQLANDLEINKAVRWVIVAVIIIIMVSLLLLLLWGGPMVGVTCGLRCFKFWMKCRRLSKLDLQTIISTIVLIIIQSINGDLTDHDGCHQVSSFSTPGDVPAPEELLRGGGDPEIFWETGQQGRSLIIGENMKLKSNQDLKSKQNKFKESGKV